MIRLLVWGLLALLLYYLINSALTYFHIGH